VADDPLLRLAMFDAGARMLAPSMMAEEAALAKVGRTELSNEEATSDWYPIYHKCRVFQNKPSRNP